MLRLSCLSVNHFRVRFCLIECSIIRGLISVLLANIALACVGGIIGAGGQINQTTIGSLSTRVFETRTATGREHFACQDNVVPQIFTLIISNGEKILDVIVVV